MSRALCEWMSSDRCDAVVIEMTASCCATAIALSRVRDQQASRHAHVLIDEVKRVQARRVVGHRVDVVVGDGGELVLLRQDGVQAT